MKIIFLATSRIALKTFYSLMGEHEIKAVITQPDRPKGRSKELARSLIAEAAEEKKVKLYKPEKLDKKLIEELKNYNADLFITFSFGVILKEEFFGITKNGGINIHPSLLPKLRGPSPIKTAILNGNKKSGITIQKINLKVDSGDILYQEEFDIKPDDNAISIEEKVSDISSDIINPFLQKYLKDELEIKPQNNSEATYCKMIKKENGLIDWNQNGENIINKIRAFINWPIAYSFIDKNRINIYKASINNNIDKNEYKDLKNGSILFADKQMGIIVKINDSFINIEELQQKGKKIMFWKDFINGYRDLAGKIFSME